MKTINQQIKDVFSQPTAPYREEWVLNYIKIELRRLKCPYFQDQWGNIFAGVKNKNEINANRHFLLAHTDHPGFHIVKKISGNKFRAQWHGGYPPKNLNAKLHIYNPLFPGQISFGKITKLIKKRAGFFELNITKAEFEINNDCFGAFAFEGYKLKNGIIHTRVADDLAGVVLILSTYERLSPKEKKNFMGIFSTAEETGFMGTLGFLKNKTLPKNLFGISLEASRAMMGAVIGQGAVIRLGDRKTLFNNNVLALLDLAASRLLKKKKIKFQRRIMNGGTCEATALNLSGVSCGGLAIPLGNYHNQKNNGTPGAEFVSLKDIEGAVQLCIEFFKVVSEKEKPLEAYNKILFKELRKSIVFFDSKPKTWRAL